MFNHLTWFFGWK